MFDRASHLLLLPADHQKLTSSATAGQQFSLSARCFGALLSASRK
jgi:hypothetical protein